MQLTSQSFIGILAINFLKGPTSVADPGCLSRIPDPSQKDSGSRIRIRNKELTLKLFLSSRKNDLGCSS